MNVTIQKTGDSIDGIYTTFKTASGAVYDASILFSTTTPNTTAYITGITYTEARAGTPGYVAVGQFFYPADTNTYPVTISTKLSASGTSLSAVGNDGTIGAQAVSYTHLTLPTKRIV